MPNDLPSGVPASESDEINELAKLFPDESQEALRAEKIDPTIIDGQWEDLPSVVLTPHNHIPCGHADANGPCREQFFTRCASCKKPTCKHHISPTDLTLCGLCNTPDKLTLEARIEPLVDDEGVTHSGRRIQPIGDTFVFGEYIDNLTDTELFDLASQYRQKIKDAEQLLYSRLLVHGTITGALTEREHKRKVKARAARVVSDATGAKTIVLPASSVPAASTTKPTIDFAALLADKSPAGVAKLAQMLEALKKL